MSDQYSKIEAAIKYIDENFKSQPSLDEISNSINLSPTYFQKLFKDWVGISPKKYLQFLSVNYAKSLLVEKEENLFNTSIDSGLSSTSRLHDLFVKIEGMTPGEYKNGGKNLIIDYSFSSSPFGEIIIASTQKGICYLAFINSKNEGLNDLTCQFSNALIQNKSNEIQLNAIKLFTEKWDDISLVKLHLKGTDFQLKVWEALLTIPYGELSTYGGLSNAINKPKASRAVGTAIGKNPIAFLIPCHRVIQSSGQTGGYRWNPIRKKVILGWEAAKKK